MEAASLSHAPWVAEDTFVLSGYGRRFVAWFLDLIAVYLSVMVAFILVFAARPGGGPIIVLGFLVIPVYYVLGNGGSRGQTLGKRIMGIAVVHESQQRVGYARALGRWFTMAVINFVPILSLLALIRPLWDKENRAFHDDIAKTRVVKIR
jgi:uncharacterized RDD family membrane protein YckC